MNNVKIQIPISFDSKKMQVINTLTFKKTLREEDKFDTIFLDNRLKQIEIEIMNYSSNKQTFSINEANYCAKFIYIENKQNPEVTTFQKIEIYQVDNIDILNEKANLSYLDSIENEEYLEFLNKNKEYINAEYLNECRLKMCLEKKLDKNLFLESFYYSLCKSSSI